MKVVIVYESTHHGNTKKLIDAIGEKYSIDMLDVSKEEYADLSGYDCIGFASGIAFGKFYEKITAFAKAYLPEKKRVFFLYTCGKDNSKYSVSMVDLAKSRDCEILGIYQCLGYDTFGPFKMIGGINKNHPNQQEIDAAVCFFDQLMEKDI